MDSNSSTLVLSGLLAGLVFFLTILCFATRWHTAVKIAMVGLALGYSLFAYHRLEAIGGWPNRQALPEKFVFLSAVFDEPNKITGSPGAIYLWLHPMEGENLAPLPRAYRMPYAADLRGILEEGMKKARDGNTQLGSANPKRGPQGSTWLRPAGSEDMSIKLSDVPRAQLPEK